MPWLVAAVTFASLSLPASARPNDDEQPVAFDLADLDRDQISDGLAAQLQNLGPAQRVDVVVTWTRRPDIDAARNAAGHFDVNVHFGIVNGFAASLTAGQIQALSKVPGVFRVEEDFEVSVLNDEATADFGTDRALNDFGVTGAGVVFCVVDTGVDATHEQLDAGKVVAWRDMINGRPTPYDDQGHGTHVASILGGDGVGGSNASKYQGVAPGVGIAAVKVLNSAGTGTESQIIQGIDWCVSQGVEGISMSLGTSSGSDGNDAMSQAVNNAASVGIIPVIAAGNAGDGEQTVGSPGAAQAAITVGAASTVADGVRLAGFSSRGPTLDGRPKPDVVSPGVDITAAQANNSSGYVAASGTSMATPFTAGVVALMLGCNPALTPTEIKSRLASTATDLGIPGADNNWGSGLIDGYQAVASACGGSGGMSLTTHEHIQGTVPNNGTYSHSFTVGTDGVGKPISATIMIQGQMSCTLGVPNFCLIWEWSPDLDARLIGPNGSVLWDSMCPLAGECGTTGQSEVIIATATQAGGYRVEIYPFADSPNNGLGGGFVMDLFHGPVVGEPPPPTNHSPVANGDDYSTSQGTSLSVPSPGVLGNDTDPDGDSLTALLVSAPSAGVLSLSPNGSFTYTPNSNFTGADSFVYRANDGTVDSPPATVTITVQPSTAIHVGDLEASTVWNSRRTKWKATVTVTVHGSGENVVSGVKVVFALNDGTTRSCTTGTTGTCLVSKDKASTVGSLTFTVTNLIRTGQTYVPASNHDPDGDSNGTAIVVIKPALP